MLLKLERILFYIFLFLIPFQIRFFLHWGGNEWNSIFLYLGDVLLIGVLGLWILKRGRKKGPGYQDIRERDRDIRRSGTRLTETFPRFPVFLIFFLLVAGLSLFVSSNLGIGIYRFIKLLEFVLLFIYVRSNIEFLKLKNIFTVLIASGVVQSILAIAQFLKQSSLGLKFIEAGVFVPGEPGVATFISNGEKIMRAYGSFPHPNVLAGFLLLCIFGFYYLFLKKKTNLFLVLCSLFIVFGLFLTFSRTAIGVFLMMSLAMFFIMIIRRMRRVQVVKLFGLFAVSCIISIAILLPHLKARFLTISLEEEALDLRFFYNKMALSMIKERPFLGVGIGNFVWHSQNYPAFLRAASKMLGLDTIPQWIYQPVHNIYLLIGAEMGLIGLIIFLGFILMRLIRPITPITFLIIGFLILGLTDHYFWSLHSGGVMFWLALALASDNSKIKNQNAK